MSGAGCQPRTPKVMQPSDLRAVLRPYTRHCLAPYNSTAEHPASRRELFAATLLLASPLAAAAAAAAASQPSAPPLGDCPECIGEVQGGLNICTLSSPSCVSTQNDDEAHFIPPWQYSGDMEAAIQQLVRVATDRGPTSIASSDTNISLRDAAGFAVGGFEATFKGGPAPKKPTGKPRTAETVCFNGRLEEQHTTADGSVYLHFVFGGPDALTPGCRISGVTDAEFIFLSGDSIVDIRTASREDPGLRGGNVALSLSNGVLIDRNVAKREMEELRKALRWEQVPVITDFDPRFNQNPLFFERLYQPFLRDR